MRSSLPIAALLSIGLAACASAPNVPAGAVAQSGPLKVHPGLVGQPVPPELQPQEIPARAPAVAENQAPAGDMRMDNAGLRTQRSVYFDLNSADLKGEFNAMLQAHASYLAQHPTARIRVEGNADERGAPGYNHKLGLKRAQSVKQSLLVHGASEKQIKVTTLGASRPKLKGHDEESWAENRRADIVYEQENR